MLDSIGDSLDFSITQTQGDFGRFPLPNTKPNQKPAQTNLIKPDENWFSSHIQMDDDDEIIEEIGHDDD